MQYNPATEREERLVSDFGDEYVLVQGGDLVDAVSDFVDDPEDYFGCFGFVLIGDGEYLEVWASTHAVPLLSREVQRVY